MPARKGRHFLSYGDGILERFKTNVDGLSLGRCEVHESTADAPVGLIDHSRLDHDGVVLRGQAQGDIGNLAHSQFGFQVEFKEKSAKADVGNDDGILDTDNFGLKMKFKPGKGSSFHLNISCFSANIDHTCMIAPGTNLNMMLQVPFYILSSISDSSEVLNLLF